MPNDGYLLSRHAVEEMRKMRDDVKRMYGNITRRLGGRQGHRDTWMPAADSNTLRVYNSYAGTIPAYGVMQISSAALSSGVTTFTVTRPTHLRGQYLVNTDSPIAQSKYGEGLIVPDRIAYSSGTPAVGQMWGPTASSFYASRGTPFWTATGAGESSSFPASLCLQQEYRGKLDGTLNQGSSATMSIWAYNGSAEADTTENVTVYDWMLPASGTIASGIKITAKFYRDSGRFYVTSAECA